MSRGSDQVGSRYGIRATGVLFVPVQDDRDVGILECSSGVKRAQRADHNRESILHVVDAGTFCLVAMAHELLKWTVFLKDRIHVPDQQDPLAALCPRMLGYQIARTAHRAHGLPMRG